MKDIITRSDLRQRSYAQQVQDPVFEVC